MKKGLTLLLTMVMLAALFTGCGSKADIAIGSKQFTENILLGEIYAQLIEAKTDLKVERRLNLGGTSICMPAMEKGEIDIYFEYTGTAFNEILDYELTAETGKDEVRQTVQKDLNEKKNITMFDPLGLNNTFAVAMKTDRMNELGITSISDLASASGQLRFGANHIFYARMHDGFNGLITTYSLDFVEDKNALKMDTSLLYDAVEAGDLDVIIVYATDAQLRNLAMTCLKDDKGLFPAYEGAPVIRNATLEKYPELSEVLNSLAGAVDDETMQELNYQVDVGKQSVEDVAKDFLTDNSYI